MKRLHRSTLFLCLILLISNITTAQSKSRNKTRSNTQNKSRTNQKAKSYFVIQGGLYQDWGKHTFSESTTEYDLAHFDAKKIGLGRLQFQGNSVSQLLFEVSYYQFDSGLRILDEMPGVFIRGVSVRPLLIEVEYFKSLLRRDKLENNFHLGYVINASYSRNKILPYAAILFEETKSCFCLGGGMKAMYVVPLFKKSILSISSDLNLFDIGIGRNFRANPNIFPNEQNQTVLGLKLLRPRIGLDIGIAF